MFVGFYSHTHTYKILQKYFGIFLYYDFKYFIPYNEVKQAPKSNTFLNKQGSCNNVCTSTLFSIGNKDVHIITYNSATYL